MPVIITNDPSIFQVRLQGQKFTESANFASGLNVRFAVHVFVKNRNAKGVRLLLLRIQALSGNESGVEILYESLALLGRGFESELQPDVWEQWSVERHQSMRRG